MAYNDSAVRVAVTGDVYFAPVGTALPNDVTTPLTATWQQTGLISEAALKESLKVNKKVLPAWQKPNGVRTVVTDVTWTWQFSAEETSSLMLELFYMGAQTSVAGGVATTTIPSSSGDTTRACVIEFVDGDVITRYAIPKVDIMDRGDVAHTNADGVFYDVTVQVLGTSIADLGYRLTNDPNLVVAGS